MNTITKIGTLEAIAFLVIAIASNIILSVPNEIINTTGTSAWINVIFIAVLVSIFFFIISRFFKTFRGSDLLDVSKYLGGELFKNIVSILYIAFYLIIGAILLRSFCEALQLVFLNAAPISFIIALFLVGIIISNLKGFGAITKLNLCIFFVVIASFIFMFFSSFESFDFRNLTPILGHGINETFLVGITNIFAYSGLVFLYFIIPFLKDNRDLTKISIISIVISSLLLLLSVISLLALFSYNINSDEILSIISVTRIINFGNLFERLDSIFIFLWILIFLSYLSTLLFFAVHTFKKTFKITSPNGALYGISLIFFALALFPSDMLDVSLFTTNILKPLIIALVFIFPFAILLLANLKKKAKRKKERLYAQG